MRWKVAELSRFSRRAVYRSLGFRYLYSAEESVQATGTPFLDCPIAQKGDWNP